MVLLNADVLCDGWLYKTKSGEKIARCGNSIIVPISFDSPRTSLRKEVRGRGWWRDPKSANYYPKNVCPACRALMLGKSSD